MYLSASMATDTGFRLRAALSEATSSGVTATEPDVFMLVGVVVGVLAAQFPLAAV